jgi:ABC-type Fe3+-hydroxamate transport system substrate-binding protein
MRGIALLCTFFCTLSLWGCGGGEEAELPQEPKRVAVLFSSLAEMWQDAGGEVAITVGESVSRGIVGAGVPLVDGGAGKTVNVELLLSLAPDLVILSEDIPAQRDAAKILRRAGIAVLACHVETLSDYLSLFGVMTELTGMAMHTAKRARACALPPNRSCKGSETPSPSSSSAREQRPPP